jgi:hypothetical protein
MGPWGLEPSGAGFKGLEDDGGSPAGIWIAGAWAPAARDRPTGENSMSPPELHEFKGLFSDSTRQ